MTVEIYDGQFDDVESDEERVTKIILWTILVGLIQGCSANSYDLANSYGFSGKNLNSFIMIFSTFYRLPTRKFK